MAKTKSASAKKTPPEMPVKGKMPPAGMMPPMVVIVAGPKKPTRAQKPKKK